MCLCACSAIPFIPVKCHTCLCACFAPYFPSPFPPKRQFCLILWCYLLVCLADCFYPLVLSSLQLAVLKLFFISIVFFYLFSFCYECGTLFCCCFVPYLSGFIFHSLFQLIARVVSSFTVASRPFQSFGISSLFPPHYFSLVMLCCDPFICEGDLVFNIIFFSSTVSVPFSFWVVGSFICKVDTVSIIYFRHERQSNFLVF